MDNVTFNEKWFLKNGTIGILLVISSLIPFSSVLIIPLIILKTRYLKNIIDDKLISAQKQADEIISSANAKILSLKDSPENKDNFIKEIIENAENAANQKLATTYNEIHSKKLELENIYTTISEKKNYLVELNEEILLQDFALYKPLYDFTNSEKYKQKIDEIREEQKNMIKSDTATSGNINWTVNNSKTEGRKMVRDTQKLLLRAFNSECEHVTGKVKYNNFDSCKKRLTNSYTAISKLGHIMNISITPGYYRLKIEELHLALEYQQMKQQEKEYQKELREQAREDAKLKKEIEETRKKVQKEKTHYENALETAKEQLATAIDQNEKNSLLQKIAELEEKMIEIKKNISDIDYREANDRAGYVYVISNLGSFGPDIYKIGMTRRLDPMERIYELGDASVPFNFDVHAMIFSDDAPSLETALHNAFDDKKLNMINTRREFFHVSLNEIEHVVKDNFDGSVDFSKLSEATQYRESEKIRQAII